MDVAAGASKTLAAGVGASLTAWRPGTDEVWYGHIKEEEIEGDCIPADIKRVSGTSGGDSETMFEILVGGGRLTWRPDGKAMAVDGPAPGGVGWASFYRVDGQSVGMGFSHRGEYQGKGYNICSVSWQPATTRCLALPRQYWDNGQNRPTRNVPLLAVRDTVTKGERIIFPTRSMTNALRAGTEADWPSWSPDGRFLVFECDDREGNADLWMAAADGSTARKVAVGASQPAWAPR